MTTSVLDPDPHVFGPPGSGSISQRQCCGSGMFIPDPDFYPSRIPDLGSKNRKKKGRGEKNLLSYLFLYHKFHKIVNYLIFVMLKKKIWANFQRIIELFTPKIVTKLSKIWVWDPGSEILKKPIPDPESRCQKGTRIRIRNTGQRYGSGSFYNKATVVRKNLIAIVL
jgi:hypothetical protein